MLQLKIWFTQLFTHITDDAESWERSSSEPLETKPFRFTLNGSKLMEVNTNQKDLVSNGLIRFGTTRVKPEKLM